MGSRRTVTLIAAIVLAAVAAFATITYVNGAQKRANKGATLVEVYVFKKDVAKGTTGQNALDSGAIAKDKIPSKFRPLNAVTGSGIEGIRAKVALTDFPANSVLVDNQFVTPKVAQPVASSSIPPGHVAVTISLDTVRSVGGNIVPGDKVDMLVSTQLPNASDADKAAGRDKGIRMLYQNVNILFIGTTVAPQPGAPDAAVNPGSGIITFEVPPLAAERIVNASINGGGGSGGSAIYLLGITQDNVAVDIPPINVGPNAADTFPPPGVLTPYDPADK